MFAVGESLLKQRSISCGYMVTVTPDWSQGSDTVNAARHCLSTAEVSAKKYNTQVDYTDK